ncbi:MAG: branched-chain amino acid ABC transporter permease [Actinomycetota bacterium]|jgi:branched-chain amino acid transport system permease protein
MRFFVQNALGGLAYGGLLFMVASGLTLVFGLMRVINIAQTSFYLIGAYIGLSLVRGGLDLWLAAIVSGLSVVLIGAAAYQLLIHRVRSDELRVVLLTIGLSLVMADGALAIWGGNPQSVKPPSGLQGGLELAGVTFPAYWLALAVFSALVAAGLFVFQKRTLLGAIIRAGVDDPEMLRGMGVRVDRAFLLVFALGAFLAGAGGLLGSPLTGIYPGLDAELLALAFAVVIVGGLGSLPGAFVGSMTVGIVGTFGKAAFPELAYFAIFAPVALTMAIRPQGLFGRRSES